MILAMIGRSPQVIVTPRTLVSFAVTNMEQMAALIQVTFALECRWMLMARQRWSIVSKRSVMDEQRLG